MAAYADGVMHAAERRLLLRVNNQLGFAASEFERLETMVRAGRHFEQVHGRGRQSEDALLADAYAVLNVSPQAGDEEIKRAYRRLLSQHHPDKLVAKGLPEEMTKLASERTHQIRSAFERIRRKRGF